MGLSRRQILAAISSGDLIISPYNDQYLKDNYYRMHNNGKIYYHANVYGDQVNTALDSRSNNNLVEVEIPKTGYTLSPQATYYMTTKETVRCEHFSINMSGDRELAKLGLNVTMDGNLDYSGNGTAVSVALTTTTPITIYPEQEITELYLNENEPGIGYVPIGGIIMYSGSYGDIPYGYRLCNGEYGTPDLRGRFIMGATRDEYSGHYGGTNQMTLQVENMPEHRHTFMADDDSGFNITSIPVSAGATEEMSLSIPAAMISKQHTTESAGAGRPFDNRPAYYTLAFIIRYM